jgi:hypothetical protein
MERRSRLRGLSVVFVDHFSTTDTHPILRQCMDRYFRGQAEVLKVYFGLREIPGCEEAWGLPAYYSFTGLPCQEWVERFSQVATQLPPTHPVVISLFVAPFTDDPEKVKEMEVLQHLLRQLEHPPFPLRILLFVAGAPPSSQSGDRALSKLLPPSLRSCVHEWICIPRGIPSTCLTQWAKMCAWDDLQEHEGQDVILVKRDKSVSFI